MAEPVIVNLNEWVWTNVATNVSTGSIHLKDSSVSYYQTFRLTGEAAPPAPTLGTIPEEAVKIFAHSNQVPISSGDYIDVYIMCANSDNDSDDGGKIRVDI